MRTLEFSVDGQKLSKSGDFSDIIKGTKGYLKCKFNFFSDDWIECKVVAVFEHGKDEYAVPVGNDRACTVPDEVTNYDYYRIKIIGVQGDSYLITTNKVLISQEE